MRRKSERGLASAVFRGFQMARGDVLGTINADFQHPPEVLGCLIERMEEADIAVASRYCKGGGIGDWPEERLMLSRAAIHTGRLVLPRVFAGLTDPLSGFYLFRRHVISGVALSPIGFKSLIEILARGRAEKIVECPYEMRARCCGKSKATFESSLDFLRQLRRLQTAHAA
jgi:dolichol-phosphate mannosyltransferase